MIGYKGWRIPEGNVVQVTDASGVVIWKLETSKPVILEVEKITSNTYAGGTTYTGEQFILLDIYPKTNGTVNITYGGLTKTITDTSGVEEPNAQQVFFGTLYGVSDGVTTPASGTLTIEGECRGFGCGNYSKTSKDIVPQYCSCITKIESFGNTELLPEKAFLSCTKITSVELPRGLKTIETNAFMSTGLTNVEIPSSVESIGYCAFTDGMGDAILKTVRMLSTIPPKLVSYTATNGEILYNAFGGVDGENIVLEQIIIPKGCANTYKTTEGWSIYADYIVEAS